jgi:hypothetical protein
MLRPPTLRILVVVVILFCASAYTPQAFPDMLVANADTAVTAAATVTPVASLLDKSYDISQKSMDKTDRVRFLGDLVINSANIAAPEKIEQWTGDLVRETRELDENQIPAWDRVNNLKLAAVALSKVNPEASMKLFAEIGPPALDTENRLPEDVRAFGARVVFLNYYRKIGTASVARIQREAENLAKDTSPAPRGAYPFQAISLIIDELGEAGPGGKAQAEALFTSAIPFYSCESKVENQEDEFLVFLQNTNGVVSQKLFLPAVREFVHHLKSDKCARDMEKDAFYASVQTSKGTVELKDRKLALLFRAFSLVQVADPETAVSLKAEIPVLEKADATIQQILGTAIDPSLSPADQDAMKKRGLRSSLLRSVRNARTSNPLAAMQMAEQIDDGADNSEVRDLAISLVMPHVAQVDKETGKHLYASSLTRLDAITNARFRSEATLGVAETAYHLRDLDSFQSLATRVFNDSLDQLRISYSRSDPVASKDRIPTDDRPGYKELAELIEFSAANGITWPVDEVQRSAMNPNLKAYMLMCAAKGLARRN